MSALLDHRLYHHIPWSSRLPLSSFLDSLVVCGFRVGSLASLVINIVLQVILIRHRQVWL